jgi:hypothetical protein
MCNLTYEKEKAQQQQILCESVVFDKKFQSVLDNIEAFFHTSSPIIVDPIIREQRLNRRARNKQRIKDELRSSYIVEIQDKEDDCQKQLEEISNNQHRRPEKERLTENMLRIIEQRQKNAEKCVKFIYPLTVNFHSKPQYL